MYTLVHLPLRWASPDLGLLCLSGFACWAQMANTWSVAKLWIEYRLFTTDSQDGRASSLPLLMFLFLCIRWDRSSPHHLSSFHGNKCVYLWVWFETRMKRRLVLLLFRESTESLSLLLLLALTTFTGDSIRDTQQLSECWLVYCRVRMKSWANQVTSPCWLTSLLSS